MSEIACARIRKTIHHFLVLGALLCTNAAQAAPTFEWLGPYEVGFEEEGQGSFTAAANFGQSATLPHETKDLGAAGETGPSTAVLRAAVDVRARASDISEAKARVSFTRPFRLVDAPNGWKLDVGGFVNGLLKIERDTLDPTAGVMVEGGVFWPGGMGLTFPFAWMQGLSSLNPLRRTQGFGKIAISADEVPDGNYEFFGSLSVNGKIENSLILSGQALSDFFSGVSFSGARGLLLTFNATPRNPALPALPPLVIPAPPMPPVPPPLVQTFPTAPEFVVFSQLPTAVDEPSGALLQLTGLAFLLPWLFRRARRAACHANFTHRRAESRYSVRRRWGRASNAPVAFADGQREDVATSRSASTTPRTGPPIPKLGEKKVFVNVACTCRRRALLTGASPPPLRRIDRANRGSLPALAAIVGRHHWLSDGEGGVHDLVLGPRGHRSGRCRL